MRRSRRSSASSWTARGAACGRAGAEVVRFLVLAVLAVVIGVFAPRRRPAALLIFAALLAMAGFTALLGVGKASIIVGALAAFGLLVLLLLARAAPRVFVFL